MARGKDRIFILGEEALDGETVGLDHVVESGSTERERIDTGLDREDGAPSSVLALYSRRRLVAGAALIGCVAFVWMLTRGGGEDGALPAERQAPAAPPVVRTPTPPSTVEPARAEAPSHRPTVPPSPGRPRPSNRPTERAEREPTSEQALSSPPIDEPAPLVEPAAPPAVSSPAQALRAGSGGRPEFGIER